MDKSIFPLIQMIASFLLVLLQISTIPVFIIYKNLRNRILYRIMLSIALSDFLQLFAIFQFTFYEYFGWKASEFSKKFASGVYIIAWDHLIVQHFLLALNRLIIFVRAFYFPTSFKEESPSERLSFNFFLILSWLIMGALQILFMTICGGIWDSETVGFFYDDSACSEKYRELEFYFTIAFPAISICCYVAIIFILKKSRESTNNINQSNQPKQQNNASNNKIKKQNQKFNNQEKRILIISVLLFSIITALIFSWYLDYKHPPWTMLFLGYLLINTSLTLSMNSEYRGHFIHMWKRLYKFIIFRESLVSNVTDIRNQQQTAAIKISSNAGTAPLFLRRNEFNARNEQAKINP
ncbi:hypothetical protein ACQ4LE_005782 [Meloidogyne hapla]